MLVSTVATTPNDIANVQTINPSENSKNEITVNAEKTEGSDNTQSNNSSSKKKTTKEIVKEYFADTPILADVASCESQFIQFNLDGTIHRGWINPQDVGVMQINEKYHLSDSIKLGFDIYTLEGNMAYAKHLYKTQGTRPWEYSSHCWNKTREVALSE